MRAPGWPAHGLKTELPSAASNPCTQRPNSNFRPFERPYFALPKGPWTKDKKVRIRCLKRLAEWLFWNPSGSDRRDPNTLAPNRRRLGRLQRARQGLVRVPESNTKYGGSGGKPGGDARSRYAQVSVSPEGFPSEKICWRSVATDFAPLFTGELFIVPDLLLVEDSGGLKHNERRCPVRHAPGPVVRAFEKRQGEVDCSVDTHPPDNSP
jgi:hypothetical protein